MGFILTARRGERRLRLGELIEVRRPDGTVIRTWIDDISSKWNPGGLYAIYLTGLLGSEDVPKGTAVWTVDEEDA